jgi:hypothetical protein
VNVHAITAIEQNIAERIAPYAAMGKNMLARAADDCIASLSASNLHFCLYGALACVMFVRAWHAWKELKLYHAREYGLTGIVHTILALLQLNG